MTAACTARSAGVEEWPGQPAERHEDDEAGLGEAVAGEVGLDEPLHFRADDEDTEEGEHRRRLERRVRARVLFESFDAWELAQGQHGPILYGA